MVRGPCFLCCAIGTRPSRSNILYAGTNYLWRWDEGPKKWERHLGGQMLAQDAPAVPNDKRDAISVIAVAPTTPKCFHGIADGSSVGIKGWRHAK